MTDKGTPPTIRSLMPDGYLHKLASLTGCMQPATLSQVVRYAAVTSKYWPAVEQLAKETNPEGFAAWQQAQAQLA